MKANAKLKDEARKHEHKEEWEKAIEAYVQVVRITEGGGDMETELPLYNRIGDLFVRLGRPIDAVTYYERAADQYAEAGLYNNAIALCNKALRYLPSRLELLRKLGQFSAAQGFITDARRWYLEYAERQLKQGALEDAFKALEDFAQVHEDAEIRELLGRHLYAHNRPAQALVALNRARELRLHAGEIDVANRLAEEIRTIDPSALVESAVAPATPAVVAPAAPPEEVKAVPAVHMEEPVHVEEEVLEEEVWEEEVWEEEVVEPAAPVAAERGESPTIDVPEPMAAAPTPPETEPGSDIEFAQETSSDELPTYEEDILDPAPEAYASFDAAPDDSTSSLEGGLIDLDSIPDFEMPFDMNTTSLSLLGNDLSLLDADDAADLPFLQGVDEPLLNDAAEPQGTRTVEHHEFEFDTSDFEFESAEPLPFLDIESPAETPVEAATPETADTYAEPEGLQRDDDFEFEETSFDEPVADQEPVAALSDQVGETMLDEQDFAESDLLTEPELEAETSDSFTAAQIEVEEIAESETYHYEAEVFEADVAAPSEEEVIEEEFFDAETIEEEAPLFAESDEPEENVTFAQAAVAEEVTETPEFLEPEPPTFELVDTPDGAPVDVEPSFEAEAETESETETETETAEPHPHHEPIPGWVPPEPPPGVEAPAFAAAEPATMDGAHELARINGLIAAGETMTAMHELDALHPKLASSGLMREAWQATDALMQLEPNNLRVLQQRLEYAAASGDYDLCLRSYLDLGRYLRRSGAEAKARVIFQRVLDLDPENAEALSFTRVAEPPRVTTGYVDLLSLISEDEAKQETTRFQVEEKPPTGDEERDFADMLSQFKQKVAENVSMAESAAHYDLGLAFKDMGLVDEAIAEFQVALKGGEARLKVYEELGQCFLLKQQYNVAVTILNRAVTLPVRDDSDLLGVFYSLGRAYEALGQTNEARAAYERVVGFDINFRDAAARLGKL